MASDSSVGTPQTAFAPDAARQASVVQSFFYTLGDLMAGTDASPSTTPPKGNIIDVAVDPTGVPYVRGTTATLPTTTSATPVANTPGFAVTPGMMLAGLAALFLWFNRGKK